MSGKSMQPSKLMQISLLSLLILTYAACGTRKIDAASTGSTGSTSTSSTTSTLPGGGGNGTDSGMWLKMNAGYKGLFWEHVKGDYNKKCEIPNLSSASVDLECVLDVPEEDLYFQGIDFTWNVPPSMCSYVYWMPYVYENYNIEPGITTINMWKNALGAGTNGDATGALTGAAPTVAANGFGADGLIKCQYDYRPSDGPNCCTGKYTANIRTWVPGTPGSWALTTTEGEWGGNIGSCLRGPAMYTQTISKSGAPEGMLYFVEGTGRMVNYVPPTPTSKKHGYSTYLANDYVTTPAPLLPSNANAYGQESYEVMCLDRAGEIKARIRMKVREWNQLGEFLNKGNPDSGSPPTTEPGFPGCEGSPYCFRNDYGDWDDMKDTGGNPIFPQESNN